MLQESPKQKGIGKNKKGHPYAFIQKLVKISSRQQAKNEPSLLLTKYGKKIKYNVSKPR